VIGATIDRALADSAEKIMVDAEALACCGVCAAK
jgi:hypothetical protein